MLPTGNRGRELEGNGTGAAGARGGSTQQWQNGGVGADKGLHVSSLIQSRAENSAGTISGLTHGWPWQRSETGVSLREGILSSFSRQAHFYAHSARDLIAVWGTRTCTRVPILVLTCQVTLENCVPTLDCFLDGKMIEVY